MKEWKEVEVEYNIEVKVGTYSNKGPLIIIEEKKVEVCRLVFDQSTRKIRIITEMEVEHDRD